MVSASTEPAWPSLPRLGRKNGHVFAPLPPPSKFVPRFSRVVLDGYEEKKGQDCFYVRLWMPPVGQIPEHRFSSEVCVRALAQTPGETLTLQVTRGWGCTGTSHSSSHSLPSPDLTVSHRTVHAYTSLARNPFWWVARPLFLLLKYDCRLLQPACLLQISLGEKPGSHFSFSKSNFTAFFSDSNTKLGLMHSYFSISLQQGSQPPLFVVTTNCYNWFSLCPTQLGFGRECWFIVL